MNTAAMPPTSLPEQIAERVERLLARHAALQEENAQLAERVRLLETERDTLRQHLAQAAERVDALIAAVPALAHAAGNEENAP